MIVMERTTTMIDHSAALVYLLELVVDLHVVLYGSPTCIDQGALSVQVVRHG